MKRFKPRLGLSARIILSMAGVVFLTALASVIIFNLIITNQTREIESRFQNAFGQHQDARRPAPVPPETSLEAIKTILNDNSLAPEARLAQVRVALRNPDSVSYGAVADILRDAGLPVSGRRGPFMDGPGDGRGRPPAMMTVERPPDNRALSPVVQSALLGSLLAAVCAVLLGLVLSRTVIRPLRELEQASQRIADGNYALEIKTEGRDDLGRLARSFNRMAAALRRTELVRKALVADVAHELRTPLASIQGYTEVLRDGLASGPQREQIYNHILKEVRHVTGMVESMRVWMSNEQALEHLTIEETPARRPAEMVIERFAPEAARQEIELSLEVDTSRFEPQVMADTDALGRVLSNLVDNALRYTPPGGRVRLRIEAPVRRPGKTGQAVYFEVSDTGSGIPPEHQPFVFERFYRVDRSRNRATGGTGLGLAIVRDTVQALGGEVGLTSEPGQGTTVRFWLPAAPAVLPARKSDAPALLKV